jgi:hypothetical protein
MHLVLTEVTKSEGKIAFEHQGSSLIKNHQDRAVLLIVW